MVRETMYQGLYLLVSNALGSSFTTMSRRLQHIDDVELTEMPAFFQNQLDEEPFHDTMTGGSATIVRMNWYVYVATDPTLTDPTSPVLNPLIDAVINLLPSVSNPVAVQINGVTYSVARGKIQYFEGLLGTKAVAKIEVIVIAPFA